MYVSITRTEVPPIAFEKYDLMGEMTTKSDVFMLAGSVRAITANSHCCIGR